MAANQNAAAAAAAAAAVYGVRDTVMQLGIPRPGDAAQTGPRPGPT